MIPRSRKRLLGLYVIALAMLVVLGGRLWYLQVLNTSQYKALASVNQTRTIVVPAVRGMITDNTGQPLVTNQTSMTVSVDMMQLSQTTKDDGKAVLARLAPLLHLSAKTLSEKVRLCTRGVPQPCWTGSPYQPIPVAEHVSAAIALQIMEEPQLFPGVTDELVTGGAVPFDPGSDVLFHQMGGHRVPFRSGLMGISLSRAFLEHTVRARVAALPGVDVRDRVAVRTLTGRAGRVTGAVLDGGEVLGADLVVDATGHSGARTDRRGERRSCGPS